MLDANDLQLIKGLFVEVLGSVGDEKLIRLESRLNERIDQLESRLNERID